MRNGHIFNKGGHCCKRQLILWQENNSIALDGGNDVLSELEVSQPERAVSGIHISSLQKNTAHIRNQEFTSPIVYRMFQVLIKFQGF